MDHASYCHKPNCSWLALPTLKGLKDIPPLTPNPELSGIGVILGFSITAYLTVALLVFHYITVYDPRRVGTASKEYTNPLDRGVLSLIREKLISWTPSRRFEYAMEKSVLILSDTQLVTGLAILIAGYSQLSCGISSYHWQIIVFVAWFSTFTFLSAMAFLVGYFQINNNLRLIRVFLMCILCGLMVTALLPTGSRNWLDASKEDGPLYPGLNAVCFFEQITMPTFTHGGPRIWSMVFSVLVVSFSYIHSGIRLFDPTAEFSRRYLRTIPGSFFKKIIHTFERRATRRGIRAALWSIPYLLAFAGFSLLRALYDIAESMLAEIIWLSFAIGWGSIKVWNTRDLAWINIIDDKEYTINDSAQEQDAWTFGQTLPLVLLLLPILSMIQAYLDNDAKAQDAIHQALVAGKGNATEVPKRRETEALAAVCSEPAADDEQTPDPRNSTSCSIRRCNHHPSIGPSRAGSTTLVEEDVACTWPGISSAPPIAQPSPRRSLSLDLPSKTLLAPLPRYPYRSFFRYHWYRDLVYLLVCHLLMLGCVILWAQSEFASILGISYIIRNRLFIIWVFGFIPVSGLIHLAVWLLAASVAHRINGAEDWLNGRGKWSGGEEIEGEDRWWRRTTTGQWVYWWLRLVLKAGCLVMAFFASAELAGPMDITIDG